MILKVDACHSRCLIASIVFVAITLLCIRSDAADPSSRPNILFIAVDDLKPVLGCYGDQVAITPSMDQIAGEATVFLNAHCQWPVCGPTRASLMTSLRPEANGVMNLKTSMRAKNPNILTLPQHFRNHGYATAGAGKIYDPRCVDDRATSDAPSWSIPFAKLPQGKIFGNAKKVVLSPDVSDDALTDGQIRVSGIKLLRRLCKSNQPFFLAVGFKKPHLPFVAPKKHWDAYQRDQFHLAAHRGGIESASGYSLHDSPEFRGYEGVPKQGAISEDLQRECIHGYYACVSFIDAQVGLLLKELDAIGVADNTTIVLWGDHGFHLGDHGMWGKHSTLEQATRVPLILRPHKGKAIGSTKSPVEFTDIFPTLCELANLPVPKELNGRSLMRLINGSAESVRDGALTIFRSRGAIGYSYRTRRYRYTEWTNKFGKTVGSELYDYQTDPHEMSNLAATEQFSAVRSTLARQLRADSQGCERLHLSKR